MIAIDYPDICFVGAGASEMEVTASCAFGVGDPGVSPGTQLDSCAYVDPRISPGTQVDSCAYLSYKAVIPMGTVFQTRVVKVPLTEVILPVHVLLRLIPL